MKISITLTNYNHAGFLPKCLDSIIAQTHMDWELIIVDDGSTDDSWAVLQRYQAKEPRMAAERFPTNRGALAAVRSALARCTGDLLYGAAADDYISNPRFFELASAWLEKNPTVPGVFGKSQVIDESAQALWIMGAYASESVYIPPDVAIREFLSAKLFIPGGSAVWRRESIEKIGGYDEALGPQCDYFVNHALPMIGGVYYLNELFSVMRLADGSLSQSATDAAYFARHALVEKKFKDCGAALPDSGLRQWRSNLISARLSFDRQMKLAVLWEQAFADVQGWERSGLLPEFSECEAFLAERCRGLRQRLEAAKASAEKIFDDIAGVLKIEEPPKVEPVPVLKPSILARAQGAMRRIVEAGRRE